MQHLLTNYVAVFSKMKIDTKLIPLRLGKTDIGYMMTTQHVHSDVECHFSKNFRFNSDET